jgi:hypothetical protein
VPFLFWRGTWFGRTLSDAELTQYLAAADKPRKAQHALAQIADRMIRGDTRVRRWYPQIMALAEHPTTEIRVTVAWVAGQDNRSQEFHRLLLTLLGDPEPMVRRNAALSLVRFGDGSGRSELLAMLRPFLIRAPEDGRIEMRLQEADTVNPGTLLARLFCTAGEPLEIRSPVPGRIQSRDQPQAGEVRAGERLYEIAPSEEQVWEALRALYLVGTSEDLPALEPYLRRGFGMPDRIRQQAQLTADAIELRAPDITQPSPPAVE